ISNTCSSSVPKRTDVNNAGGSVLDDHNPPKWVTFACRFTRQGENQETDDPIPPLATSKTSRIINHATEPEPPMFKPL
ncbi:MAG: hypothetical protein P8O10_00965, partial [Pseudorhodobacter sp.]|nr:hypothetical protein [Pseudorhodobacter sp.]